MDPLEQFHSPYNYAGNNPILMVDPTGMYSSPYEQNMEEGNSKTDPGFRPEEDLFNNRTPIWADNVHYNSETNETTVVETSSSDVLYVDGEFYSAYGTDGAWKSMSFDNVSLFSSAGDYVYDKYGKSLLNDNLYASLMDKASSLEMQLQISGARRKAFMNKAAAIPIVTVSVPIALIGGAELLAAAPAIGSSLSSGYSSVSSTINAVYWKAGSYVNYLNIWGSEMLYQPMVWKIARTAIPILYSPQVRRYGDQVFRYLLKESYRGGINIQNTTKSVTETFILPPGSHFE